MDRLVVLTVCMLIHWSLCQFNKDAMGPFNVVCERIDHCEDSGVNLMFLGSTRISKVGRNLYMYSTNVTLLEELSDELNGYSDIAVWGNGGWRPHFFQFDFPNLCTTGKYYFPGFRNKAMERYGIEECPIPPGVYEITNLTSDDTGKLRNLPMFQYGKYRADFYVKKNETIMGCLRAYYQIKPKRIVLKKPQRKS